jgi:transcriptional regulator with XRE-family HTH domain
MVAQLKPPTLAALPWPDAPDGLAFGALLRQLRILAGLSQNRLARAAGVDPAYVNRLERAPADSGAMPRRGVVLSLHDTLMQESLLQGGRVGELDRDRLLAAAGHVPEAVLAAGGWDAYQRRIRSEVLDGLTQVLGRLDAALHPDAPVP